MGRRWVKGGGWKAKGLQQIHTVEILTGSPFTPQPTLSTPT